ncbi:YopX family protein [uncultured Campylobacter sp.]|uniref:YopX family protein n=1 Tax=uncultured Campylobacter sp. TaxID=218934 RepID=UPI00261B8ABB|nr:YopX family protein [uncultured Campylobacter sp.]
MGEIKFRAWNVLDKKMLNWGDIFHLPAWEIFPGTPEQRPFNIMQYTGMEDKNGREIYEGDIIKYDDAGGEAHTQVVRYDDEMGAFGCDRGALMDHFNCMWEIEVLGNIYENPELLENKGEEK